jgi:ABC-2 type transport system permease protein
MLKVYLKFKSLSIRVAMEYVANFWMMAVSGIAMRGVFYLVVLILFRNLPTIAGWSEMEILMMMGFLFGSEGFCTILFDGVWHVTGYVYTGKFDTILARPVSPLYQVLCDQIGLQGFGIVPLGLITLGIAMHSLSLISPLNILLAVLFLTCGVVLRMSTTLMFVTTVFYIKGSNVNIPFLAHSVSEYGRYPLEVYPFWMRFVLLVIVPAGFAGYVPALVMRGYWPLQLTITLVAVTILYFLAARMFFYRGIKKYESMGM